MGCDLIFGFPTLIQTEHYTSSSGIAGAAVEISFLFYSIDDCRDGRNVVSLPVATSIKISLSCVAIY